MEHVLGGIAHRIHLVGGEEIVNYTRNIVGNVLGKPDQGVMTGRDYSNVLNGHLQGKLCCDVTGTRGKVEKIEPVVTAPSSHEMARSLEAKVWLRHSGVVVVSVEGSVRAYSALDLVLLELSVSHRWDVIVKVGNV